MVYYTERYRLKSAKGEVTARREWVRAFRAPSQGSHMETCVILPAMMCDKPREGLATKEATPSLGVGGFYWSSVIWTRSVHRIDLSYSYSSLYQSKTVTVKSRC